MPKKAGLQNLLPPRNGGNCVVYVTESGLVTGKDRGSPINACRVYNLMIFTMLFCTLVICACVYAATSVIEKRVLTELISHQREMDVEREQQHQEGEIESVGQAYEGSTENLSSVVKRSANSNNDRERRRRRRRRGRRGRRREGGRGRGRDTTCCNHQQIQKSAVHLNITPDNICTYDDETVGDRSLVWQRGSPNFMVNLQYVFHPDRQNPNDVLGIKVRHSGMYEIYSQVIIKAYTPRQYPYYCAQELILIRGNVKQRVLLKSFATQPDFYMNGRDHPPIDSVYQFGVFYLHRNDEVRVSACEHVRFVCGPEGTNLREGFYFGVIQR